MQKYFVVNSRRTMSVESLLNLSEQDGAEAVKDIRHEIATSPAHASLTAAFKTALGSATKRKMTEGRRAFRRFHTSDRL